MTEDLTEYLKTHPPSGDFHPGARYNADGNQLEVFWEQEEAYGTQTDNHKLCVLWAMSDGRPVGVTVYGIRELLPPEMQAAPDLLAACEEVAVYFDRLDVAEKAGVLGLIDHLDIAIAEAKGTKD